MVLIRSYSSKKERPRIIGLQFANSWIENFHLNRLAYIDVHITWAPHSPDLMVIYFFFWRYIKDSLLCIATAVRWARNCWRTQPIVATFTQADTICAGLLVLLTLNVCKPLNEDKELHATQKNRLKFHGFTAYFLINVTLPQFTRSLRKTELYCRSEPLKDATSSKYIQGYS